MTRLRRLARRALGWIGWGALALLIAVVLLLAVALTTTCGLRLVVALGLKVYGDRIAGSASIDDVDGILVGRFVLRGVMLRDRRGQALVTVDAITVDWSPWPLLGGNLVVRELRLDRTRVHLTDVHGVASDWGDLAPPFGLEPDDPDAPPGPDLPLGLDVALRLRDAAVLGAGADAIVETLDLDARAQAAGRVARLELRDVRAGVRDAPTIRDLRLDATWSSPVVTLSELRLLADGAAVRIPSAELDVRHLDGALDLRASVALAALEPLLPRGTADRLRALGPRIDLAAHARGVPEDMSADLRLALAPDLELAFAGSGAWRGAPRADVQLRADLDLAALTDRAAGRIAPALDLRARPLDDDRLAFAGAVRCRGCDAVGGLSAGLVGVLDLARGDLSLQTDLELAGVRAALDLRALGGAVHDLDAALTAADLARPAALARLFVPTFPPIRGALSVHGGCRGPELRCAAALELRRLSALDVIARSARIDLRARTDMFEWTAGFTVRGLRRSRAAARPADSPSAAWSSATSR